MTDEDLQADASFLEAAQGDYHHVALHRSQILRLETDELLKECYLELDHISWASHQRDYLNLISNLILKFQGGTVNADDCPFPLLSKKIASVNIPKGSKFSIAPIGSYALDFLTKKAGNANVIPTLDCAIVIPNSYWDSKDYLNHRYMDKRNIILWNISKFLSENKKYKRDIGSIQWRYYNGNPYIISLILTPPISQKSQGHKKKKMKSSSTKSTKQKFRFQFVMAMESTNWIQITRLFPNRSNIKGLKRSTYYNSMLVKDGTWVQTGQMLKEDIDDLPYFRQTFVLTKIWLLQRGFLRGRDSLDDLQVAVLLLYIYRSRKATSRMPPLQAFTVLMRLLASAAFRTTVSVMPNAGVTETKTIASSEAAIIYLKNVKESPLDSKNGDPKTLKDCYQINSAASGYILLDSNMLGNYLENLSPSFCDSLQYQAARTISHLNSTGSFSTIFMTNARFWSCLDAYVKVHLKDIDWEKMKKLENLLNNSSNELGQTECLSRNLTYMLKRALGDRINEIRVLTSGNGCNISALSSFNDTDEIPTSDVRSDNSFHTPETIVIGLKINAETCHRAVDRGPPAENVAEVRDFEQLWGDVVELRRFKDGAIVHAVVWDTLLSSNIDVVYEGGERSQGGIVECIVQHIIGLHFCKKCSKKKHIFLLRDILGLIDGARSHDSITSEQRSTTNATLAHRNILNTFDLLANFLRKNSEESKGSTKMHLGLPLPIDAVEPLSASLRYSDPFPPIPHPLLGGTGKGGKVTFNIPYSPIKIQVRFSRSSKWPNDLKAIGAAKSAMLIQLADGIEAMKSQSEKSDFDGPIIVTPSYLLLGFRGYSWKIVVRADPELHLLRGLHKPNNEALSLLQTLTKDHVTASSHHSTIHAVHTLHPSASHVVRLFQQWLATHMLSGLIPFEVVELLVAKVYSDTESPIGAPSSLLSGFLRVLYLLGNHDWMRCPMIVDPHNHLRDKEKAKIQEQFQQDRGHDMSKGSSMYIVAAYDCIDPFAEENDKKNTNWSKFKISKPSFASFAPERVILFRAATLAKRSYSYLLECLRTGGDWRNVFQETQSSLKSYSLLMRIDSSFAVDNLFCSTGDGFATNLTAKIDAEFKTVFSRHALAIYNGNKSLQRKVYRNLNTEKNQLVLHDWNPMRDTLDLLRKQLGDRALFFYNEFAPQVIALLWRPDTFKSLPFNVMNSEFTRPVGDSNWKNDTMGIANVGDMIRLLRQITQDIVVDMKILDSHHIQSQLIPKKKRSIQKVNTSSDSEGQSDTTSSSDYDSE